MDFWVLIPVITVLYGLRLYKNMNIIGWMAAWWVAIYIVLKYGILPPLPASIIGMFMFIVSLALAAYLSTNTDDLETVKNGLVSFFTNSKNGLWLILVLIGLPVISAYNVYSEMTAPPQPPASGRTIHPPPPTSISFKGKKIDLDNDENPNTKLKEADLENYQKHVANGRKVYFQNCVYCHGDDMAGKGIFAHGYDPLPANFRDPTTIAMLRETYLFWRIAKGGPGLPNEATPWLSAMPAWENFLTEEEVWDVITFMYEYTGQKPREKEEH